MHARSVTRSRLPLFVVLVSLASPGARGEEQAKAGKFFFRDGDAVVMMGDSITKAHLYSSYVDSGRRRDFPAGN